MNLLSRHLLAVACGVAITSGVQASTAVVERAIELDLTKLLASPVPLLQVTAAVDAFTLDEGDKLIFHVGFAGRRLTFKDVAAGHDDYIGLQFNSNPPGQTGFLFTGNWHLEGVQGALLANDLTYMYGGPIGGFTANTNLTNGSFSFSGITYTVDVTYKEPGRPAFSTDSVDFSAFVQGLPEGSGLSLQPMAPVPEPEAYAMGLVAFAVLGLLLRCRKLG